MKTPVSYVISPALVQDWAGIMDLVSEMGLDHYDMRPGQFMVCRGGGNIIGIGRVKVHADCMELCSLGVRQAHRGNGIGKALVSALTADIHGPVYVVTDIPAYFEKLGFRISGVGLQTLLEKKKLCLSQFSCVDPVIMAWQAQ